VWQSKASLRCSGSWLTIAGILGNVNSLLFWTVFAAVALVLPVVVMRWWSEPRQSMSQSIQEALR
jgi:uncharacterized membrane protein YedE/YeeE